ncbi:hypothetical protein BKA83DRAFT_299006 [Pisolithus microcarpus]|nr:hypothetical protein BKA83DRAFT_299006 [Pisolithus microcarpus]
MASATANEFKQLVTLAVVGCGQRGKGYARYALNEPHLCKIVTVAEPRENTRQLFARAHNVDDALVFNHWQDLLQASAETIETLGRRLADAVIVAVQDDMHREVVLAFAAQGYHVLCEKPMATTLRDCLDMEAAKSFARAALGELVNAVHVEPVGYYHFAHSYTILCHWLLPATPTRVSSFGSLYHFRKDQKPAASNGALRCLQCPVERKCPYSAKKIYLDAICRGDTSWPVSVLVDGLPDIENVTHALQNGPYGRCVYESDNDVCDHQVVNIEFSSGATASFTMVAHTSLLCERQTRLHFTHGEIVGDMSTFSVTDFRTGRKTKHYPKHEGGGHGGGDLGLVSAFVEAVRTNNQACLGTDVSEILNSHLTVFAAESSRREGRVVDCAEHEKGIKMALDA